MLGLLDPSTGDVATGPDEGPAGCEVSKEGIPVVEEEIPVMDEEVPMTVGITLDFCRSPCKGTSDAVIRKAKALRKDEWYL